MNATQVLGLAVLKMIFNFVLGPPLAGGPEGGSGLSFPSENLRFWADPGPDPGGNPFFIFVLA